MGGSYKAVVSGPRPITEVKDLKKGGLYFKVVVAKNLELHVRRPFVAKSIPLKGDFGLSYVRVADVTRGRLVKFQGNGGFIGLLDAGIQGHQAFGDNHHRLFRYTERNFRKMEKIVLRQDLLAYYSIIGHVEFMKFALK